MINKKLISKFAVLGIIITLVISIVFFILNYSAIRADRKFDFSYDWFLIICDIFLFIIISIGLYNNKKKSGFYKEIILNGSNMDGNSLEFAQILFFSVFVFGIFVFSKTHSFAQLSSSFIMGMLFIQRTSCQIYVDGIYEKGISYYGHFYCWEKIQSYKIIERGNFIFLKFYKKVLVIQKIKIFDTIIKEKDKGKISEFLDLKLNN